MATRCMWRQRHVYLWSIQQQSVKHSSWALGERCLILVWRMIVQQTWLLFADHLFPDASDVFRWEVWTACRSVKNLDSSTMKPCCCYRCCGLALSCKKSARPSLKKILSERKQILYNIVLKPVKSFLQWRCLSRCVSCPWTPIPSDRQALNCVLMACWMVPLLFIMVSMFVKRVSEVDLSDFRTAFRFVSIHFKLTLAKRRRHFCVHKCCLLCMIQL